MEDSYTVHRRRKAAARRREKTPDPSSRSQQLVETSEDEEAARRARMEQMADDAERAEVQEKKTKLEEEPKAEERKKRSPTSLEKADKPRMSSPLKEAQARENDADDEVAARSVKKELVSKATDGSPVKEASKNSEEKRYQDVIPRSKEIDGDMDQPVEPRKVERRLKKKSRERIERHGQSTDSSDMEEIEKHPRRTKSPEGGKIRVKKTVSRKITSTDGEVKEVIEKPPREKRSSKQKLEDTDVKPERRQRVHSHTDDTDEDRKMKKSESFPRQTGDEVKMKRSSSDVKKQIIPLSNDSLIQDFAKAQKEYLKREQSILDPETPDVFEDAQEETTLRRRKFSIPLSEQEQEAIEKSMEKLKETQKKRSWFSWVPFLGRRKVDKDSEKTEDQEEPVKTKATPKQTGIKLDEVKLEKPKTSFLDFLRAMKDVVAEFKAFVAQNPKEADIVRSLRNRCMSELMLVIIYCGLGAFVFRFTEGAFETFYKCGVKRVKRDFLDSLWNYSHNLREDDWKSMARRKLMEFEEQLHTAHEAGMHTYSGQRSWTFLNAVVYCLTVITTIGEKIGTIQRRTKDQGSMWMK